MRRALQATALLAIGACAAPAWAFCPSFSSLSSGNTNNCGVAAAAGTNPAVAAWQEMIETACAGPAGSGWANGPTIPDVGAGCGGGTTKVPARFPCELIEAIAMQESGWVQFCIPSTPADQAGLPSRTIVSFDCGYGVAQVTSGMHTGETPAFDRDRVAGDPLYSLQVGLKILAEKWSATACVGDNQPTVVEDWYLATWAYNGLSFSNNPNNPNLDAMRPVCDPNVGCAGRTYQERVWGWMEHPPKDGRWSALQPAYPDPSEIPSTSGVKITALSEPHCESPTSCTTGRTVHTTRCSGTPPDLGGGLDAGLVPDMSGGGGDQGCGCTVGRGTGADPTPLAVSAGVGALLALLWLRHGKRHPRR
jgi:hypothetical protein